MNREIKFRVWDKEMKWMRVVTSIYFNRQKVLVTSQVEKHCHDGITTLLFSEVILLQYIGKKDKNDKEIYEGDIIKYDDTNVGGQGYVVFSNETAEYIIDDWKKGNTNSNGYSISSLGDNLEIIGNIYENPNLI